MNTPRKILFSKKMLHKNLKFPKLQRLSPTNKQIIFGIIPILKSAANSLKWIITMSNIFKEKRDIWFQYLNYNITIAISNNERK